MSNTDLKLYSSVKQIVRAFPDKRYFFLIRTSADLFIANKAEVKILLSRFVINDVTSDGANRYPGAYADTPKLSVYDGKTGQRYVANATAVLKLLLSKGYYAVYGHNRFCLGQTANELYQASVIDNAIQAYKSKQ